MRSVKFVFILFYFFIEAQDLHISYPFLHLKLYFLSLLFWGVELNGHKCLQNAKMVPSALQFCSNDTLPFIMLPMLILVKSEHAFTNT